MPVSDVAPEYQLGNDIMGIAENVVEREEIFQSFSIE